MTRFPYSMTKPWEHAVSCFVSEYHENYFNEEIDINSKGLTHMPFGRRTGKLHFSFPLHDFISHLLLFLLVT